MEIREILSVALKRLTRSEHVKPHEVLKQLKDTSTAGSPDFFFLKAWASAAQGTQRMLVLDGNRHGPSPPCPAVAPSLPVCCNAYNSATAEMQAMPRAASPGEERRADLWRQDVC